MGVRKLPSGRHQARFTYQGRAYAEVWDTERQATAWIQRTRRDLVNGTYRDPATGLAPAAKGEVPLFRDYAATWVAERDLKPRTRAEYTRMLESFGPLDPHPLDRITRAMVKDWHSGLTLKPTGRKHVYELLRAIFNSAVDDEHIDVSPVRIKGAAKSTKRVLPDLPTAVQVHQLADAMPTAKYRVMTLLAAWCGLRFGEVTELRRKDVVTDEDGTPLAVQVRRGVTRVEGQFIVGTPKSAAGVRNVTIPPHIRGDLAEYLQNARGGPERLLFPGTRNGHPHGPQQPVQAVLRRPAKVGLPNLRWHDLRHFSATIAAQSGATLAELQARLGHSTVHAAMRYQQAVNGRDEVIAEAMSNVVALKPRTAGIVAAVGVVQG